MNVCVCVFACNCHRHRHRHRHRRTQTRSHVALYLSGRACDGDNVAVVFLQHAWHTHTHMQAHSSCEDTLPPLCAHTSVCMCALPLSLPLSCPSLSHTYTHAQPVCPPLHLNACARMHACTWEEGFCCPEVGDGVDLHGLHHAVVVRLKKRFARHNARVVHKHRHSTNLQAQAAEWSCQAQ